MSGMVTSELSELYVYEFGWLEIAAVVVIILVIIAIALWIVRHTSRKK